MTNDYDDDIDDCDGNSDGTTASAKVTMLMQI